MKYIFCLILIISICFCADSTMVSIPEKIVINYLEMDAAGEFLKQSNWLNENMLYPEFIPAWDNSTLIKSYKITDFKIDGNKAFVNVEYEKMGDVLQNSKGFYVEKNEKVVKIIFELHKVEKFWKIAKPIQNQHVMMDAVEDRLTK